jgi:phage terminase large subunit-like protein
MTDKSNKPLGTFAKLMSSSPIKEEEKQNSGKPENLKTGNQDIKETRKPENLKTGILENLKAEKYSTQLHKDTILRLKQYALINDVKDYEVVEKAIIEYLDKKQSGNQENLKT